MYNHRITFATRSAKANAIAWITNKLDAYQDEEESGEEEEAEQARYTHDFSTEDAIDELLRGYLLDETSPVEYVLNTFQR